MNTVLHANFTKSFKRGAVIEATLGKTLDGFSVGALFGPSGCGKTTILRCLAGLEKPESGTIQFGDEIWLDADKGICLPPQKRKIGFLFQDYALFPHLTVAKNIAYGLDMPNREKTKRVAEMLDFVELQGYENHYPSQISGGQQQRVALARAMVLRPKLLLLDEPLSALDAPTREKLRPELHQYLNDFGTPALMVSHDRAEVLSMADHMTVMEKGKILQSGPTHEIFKKPSCLSVAKIVGVDTVERGKIIEISDGLATVQIGDVTLQAMAPYEKQKDVFVCIRAEDVILQEVSENRTSARNQIKGKISSMQHDGPLVRVIVDCGFNLISLVTRPATEELNLVQGKEVFALLKAPSIHLLPNHP